MTKKFAGKVALVTGSSSGIGKAVAIQLAEKGAKVTITGRDAKLLAEVAAQIVKVSGEEPLQIVGNFVTQPELPEKLINETVAKFGRLDVLVNNAGGGNPNDSFLSANLMEAYDSIFQLNVRSVLEVTRHAIPHLETTKGNIVNVSSVASLRPMLPMYSMSKAALDMMTEVAAQELGPKGIRVNAVNPGPVATNFFRSLGINSNEERDKLWDTFRSTVVLDMLAQPVEIANLITFLASSDAANITGTSIRSDTGMLVKKMIPDLK